LAQTLRSEFSIRGAWIPPSNGEKIKGKRFLIQKMWELSIAEILQPFYLNICKKNRKRKFKLIPWSN
jgi:hypothetical protein